MTPTHDSRRPDPPRGTTIDENAAMNAAGARSDARRNEGEVGDCIAEVERRMGRRLSTPQRSQALMRHDAGESAAAIADWLYRQEAARLTVNDPLERRCDTPARRDRP